MIFEIHVAVQCLLAETYRKEKYSLIYINNKFEKKNKYSLQDGFSLRHYQYQLIALKYIYISQGHRRTCPKTIKPLPPPSKKHKLTNYSSSPDYIIDRYISTSKTFIRILLVVNKSGLVGGTWRLRQIC